MQSSKLPKTTAEAHIRPHVMEWDEAQHFPIDLMHRLGEQGFLGVIVPEEYGGSGLGYHEYITVIEEITKVCSSIGLSVAAHNSLCTHHIYTFGTQKIFTQISHRAMDWCLGLD